MGDTSIYGSDCTVDIWTYEKSENIFNSKFKVVITDYAENICCSHWTLNERGPFCLLKGNNSL